MDAASEGALGLGDGVGLDVPDEVPDDGSPDLPLPDLPLIETDNDYDGVDAQFDCNDKDPRVGALLFEEDFSAETALISTPTLTDPWTVANGTLSNVRGGQQARLSDVGSWTDTVTFAGLSAHGLERKCLNCSFGISAAFASPEGSKGGHALVLAGMYDSNPKHDVRLRFREGARFHFDKYTGAAVIKGTAYVYSLGDSPIGAIDDTWEVIFQFVYRGQGPAGEGPDGPKLELKGDVQGPEITDQWQYFDFVNGVMTRADGAVITFAQLSTYPMQLGLTANGKNLNFGTSVWFSFVGMWPDGTLTNGHGDINADLKHRDRFRAGILARANVDVDQDEGFHGYRCAVARNSQIDCHDPGRFVQIAAFTDKPEDDVQSECEVIDCPDNTTFDQLRRVERSEQTDLLAGDSVELAFWAVGPQLVCEFSGIDGEHVVAYAQDLRFTKGHAGLSTLNALADFDYIRVCEAFAVP